MFSVIKNHYVSRLPFFDFRDIGGQRESVFVEKYFKMTTLRKSIFLSQVLMFLYSSGLLFISLSIMSRKEYPAFLNALHITSVHTPILSGGYPSS